MMRVHQPTASCGTRFGWLLAVVAAIVIVVQASWLHSLRGVCRSVAVAQEAALRAAQHSLVALNTSAPPPCPLLAPVAATASGIHDANLSSSSLAELSTNTSLDAPPAPSAPPVVPSCARTPPRVMVVTAEQPTECSTATAQWLGARAMRNRMNYAQAHGYKLYWNTDNVDPDYPGIKESGMWNKPALLYKLLTSNLTDGVEWLLWIDSDAFFMDMDFALPLDEYDAAGFNLVLWGETRKVDVSAASGGPDYFGINAGVLLLRNCDWTRAFLRAILDAGMDIAGSTALQGAALKGMCDRAYDCVVSDQSTIVYLLHTQPERWRAQTLLEKRFALNGHWQEYYGRLVSGSLKLSTDIWGSDRVPFIMHFAGCQLCSGRTDAHYADWGQCRDAMAQALNHVEDWALAKLGLKHVNLTSLEVEHADGPPTYPDPPPPPPPEEETDDEDDGADDAGQHAGAGAEGDDTTPASSSDEASLAALQPPPQGP